MLICLAGLRSIPDYIYEAAEVDRASPLRQFWSITPAHGAALHHAGGAVRGIENFKMFDMVNLLTGGGPGSTTEVASDHAEARSFREMAHRLFLGLRHHPIRRGVRPRQHLCEGAQPGEAAMSLTTAHSVVAPTPLSKQIAAAIVIVYALISIVPLLWIFATSFKTPPDSIAYPPKIVFQPSVRGLLQPVYDPHPPDPRIYRLAAARRQFLRRGHAQAQHGDRRPVQLLPRASSIR